MGSALQHQSQEEILSSPVQVQQKALKIIKELEHLTRGEGERARTLQSGEGSGGS